MGLLEVCTKCKVEKPLTAEYFPLHNKKKSGFDSWCRQCRSMHKKTSGRAKKYGISNELLKELYNAPCVICGKKSGSKVIDHCHVTGKVRGGLCQHCNLALGHFKDDPERLLYAAAYLLQMDNWSEFVDYVAK